MAHEKPSNSTKLFAAELIGWVKGDPKHSVVQSSGQDVELLEFAFIKNDIFINCAAWRGLAARHKDYLKANRLVRVTGTVEPNKYTTKDGVEKEAFRISVDNITYLDENPANSAAKAPAVEVLAPDQLF